MMMPTHGDAFEVLLLQAADDGRGPILFGESLARARAVARPFMVGDEFPSVYLEHPLVGDPFLDVTVLLKKVSPGTRIPSDAAAGSEGMLDWYAGIREKYDDVCCGYELDTKREDLAAAAIHFQPRNHTELVVPFCEVIGEPSRASLYLRLGERMPRGWPLSFFGMFRGRPGSPLRVCGYLGSAERGACAEDPARLREVFRQVGFTAYDQDMLRQAAEVFAVLPGSADFQFDVWPDGTLGDTFSLDAQFGIERPAAVRSSFEAGVGAKVMGLLQSWGAADGRWRLGAEAAFARSLPVVLPDDTVGRYAFTLMPQWAKVRWANGMLQPSKLYLFANAGLLEDGGQRV